MSENEKKKSPSLKEPSLFSKLVNSIVVNDLPTAAKDVLIKVVGPRTQDLIVTILKALVDSMFGRGGTTNTNTSRVTSTPYQSFWGSNNRTVAKSSYDEPRPMQQDIWFETEAEATDCYFYMVNLVKSDGFATVNRLYDKAGLTVPHTADNWGWTDFTRARIVPGTNDAGASGWVLSTPRPIAIDRS